MTRKLPMLAAFAAVAGLWLLAVVPAALSSGGRTPEQWRAARDVGDAPELWSIQAEPSPAGWRPVRICTNAHLRSGFIRPALAVGDAPCIATEEPVKGAQRIALRCSVNGQTIGQSTTWEGDLHSDFRTRVSFTHLAATLAGRPDATYEQTLHYRRLGACPEGWEIGEATDHLGRRSNNTTVDRPVPLHLR